MHEELKGAANHRQMLAHLPATADFQSDGSICLVLAPTVCVAPTLTRKRPMEYDTAGCTRLAFDFEQLATRVEAFAVSRAIADAV